MTLILGGLGSPKTLTSSSDLNVGGVFEDGSLKVLGSYCYFGLRVESPISDKT